MSQDPEQEYFCDGIVEDLITAMSKFRELVVIARNSTFTYKGQAVKTAQVGHDLNVRYVVEGSVRRAGNRVRITAQLVEAETGTHLWADRFDRELNDIFAVQDEITSSIAGTLGHTLRTASMAEARCATDAELDVWNLIARGSWHLARYTQDDNVIARGLFRDALEKEPENANAMAFMGFAICLAVVFGWRGGEEIERAFSVAKNAMAAEPENGMAHACVGFCHCIQRDRAEAERNYATALSLNPNDAFSHYLVGMSQGMAGDRDAAFDSFAKAERLSPRDPFMATATPYMKALTEYLGGDLVEALPWAELAVQVNPIRAMALRIYVAVVSELGLEDKIRESAAELEQAEPDFDYGTWLTRIPIYADSDRERMMDALKAAGVKG